MDVLLRNNHKNERETSADRISRGIKTWLAFQSMHRYFRNKEAIKGTKWHGVCHYSAEGSIGVPMG